MPHGSRSGNEKLKEMSTARSYKGENPPGLTANMSWQIHAIRKRLSLPDEMIGIDQRRNESDVDEAGDGGTHAIASWKSLCN